MHILHHLGVFCNYEEDLKLLGILSTRLMLSITNKNKLNKMFEKIKLTSNRIEYNEN